MIMTVRPSIKDSPGPDNTTASSPCRHAIRILNHAPLILETATDSLSRRQSQMAAQKGHLQGDILFEPGSLIQIEMPDG